MQLHGYLQKNPIGQIYTAVFMDFTLKEVNIFNPFGHGDEEAGGPPKS